jgi:hypothetical protein
MSRNPLLHNLLAERLSGLGGMTVALPAHESITTPLNIAIASINVRFCRDEALASWRSRRSEIPPLVHAVCDVSSVTGLGATAAAGATPMTTRAPLSSKVFTVVCANTLVPVAKMASRRPHANFPGLIAPDPSRMPLRNGVGMPAFGASMDLEFEPGQQGFCPAVARAKLCVRHHDPNDSGAFVVAFETKPCHKVLAEMNCCVCELDVIADLIVNKPDCVSRPSTRTGRIPAKRLRRPAASWCAAAEFHD